MELNKAVLDCMQAVRRKLKQEMALDIRLSQQDAVSAMLSACSCSKSDEIRQLGARLAELSDEHPAPAATARAISPAPVPAAATHVAQGPSVRIYRGQRIYA